MRTLIATAAVVALFAGACSSDDSSDDTTTTTEPDVEAAFSEFCETATTYIDELNEYTGLFSDEPATITVGQVKEGSEGLKESAEAVKADSDSLQKAIEDYNEIQKEKAEEQEKSTGTTSTMVVLSISSRPSWQSARLRLPRQLKS